MRVTAIWTRFPGDNTIAVDGKIPWNYPSDFKRFKHITMGGIVIVGRKTYETLPNRTLVGRKILVVSKDKNYQVSDKVNHMVISNPQEIFREDVDRFVLDPETRDISDLYICGGAEIYKMFFEDPTFKPDYVVDCRITEKEMIENILKIPDKSKTFIDVDILYRDYFQIACRPIQDEIYNCIFIKKDKMLNHLLENISKKF